MTMIDDMIWRAKC